MGRRLGKERTVMFNGNSKKLSPPNPPLISSTVWVNGENSDGIRIGEVYLKACGINPNKTAASKVPAA